MKNDIIETDYWGNERSVLTPEAAKILRVANQTLHNWRYQGKGPPYFKVGRGVRYLVSDLQKFISANKIIP